MDYPIFFKLSPEVRCRGFGARAIVSGRALMVFDDDEWWCHGVEPGGLTAHGKGPGMAFAAFKATLGEILGDIASDSKDFDEFVVAVREFASAADSEEASRWEAARAAIRAGQEVDWTFRDTERITGEWSIGVKVQKLDQVSVGVEAVALAEGRVA